LSKQANDIKRSIKALVKSNQPAAMDTLKRELAVLKETQSAKEQDLKSTQVATEQLLLVVGNSVHKDVVESKDEANNRIVRYFNPKWSTPVLTVDNNTNHQ
jgi:seryl-tRNA synthetase